MERVTKILKHPEFINELREIERLETNREFCNHDIQHFFDVARIAYIISLEEKMNFDKEIIYAIGLLHDIGRARQYRTKENHEEAGVEISKKILRDCGFDNQDIETVLKCIKCHREKNVSKSRSDLDLCEIIKLADQWSRKCFMCKSIISCKWDNSVKNLGEVIV